MTAPIMRSDWLWWFKENLAPVGELKGGRDMADKRYKMDRELATEVFTYLKFTYGGDTRVMKRCPQCKDAYFPDCERGIGTPEQREQHITGLCFTFCWLAYLGASQRTRWERYEAEVLKKGGVL